MVSLTSDRVTSAKTAFSFLSLWDVYEYVCHVSVPTSLSPFLRDHDCLGVLIIPYSFCFCGVKSNSNWAAAHCYTRWASCIVAVLVLVL